MHLMSVSRVKSGSGETECGMRERKESNSRRDTE